MPGRFGTSDADDGVTEATATGVFGTGPGLAAGFNGDVYVTGLLTVSGLPISALIQRVDIMAARITEPESLGGTTNPATGSPWVAP